MNHLHWIFTELRAISPIQNIRPIVVAASLLVTGCSEGNLDDPQNSESTQPEIAAALNNPLPTKNKVYIDAKGNQAVTLSWPPINDAVEYLILKNGFQIGSTSQESFTETTTDAGVVDYSIVAVFESIQSTVISENIRATVEDLGSGTITTFFSNTVVPGNTESSTSIPTTELTDSDDIVTSIGPSRLPESSNSIDQSAIAENENLTEPATIAGQSPDTETTDNPFAVDSSVNEESSNSDTTTVAENQQTTEGPTNSTQMVDSDGPALVAESEIDTQIPDEQQETEISSTGNLAEVEEEPTTLVDTSDEQENQLSVAIVEVEWLRARADDYTYNVYFSESSDGLYTLVKSVDASQADNNRVKTDIDVSMDLALESQSEVCFKVTGVGTFGESARSDHSCVVLDR